MPFTLPECVFRSVINDEDYEAMFDREFDFGWRRPFESTGQPSSSERRAVVYGAIRSSWLTRKTASPVSWLSRWPIPKNRDALSAAMSDEMKRLKESGVTEEELGKSQTGLSANEL